MPDFNLEGHLILTGANIAKAQRDLNKLQLPKLNTGNFDAITDSIKLLSLDFAKLIGKTGQVESAIVRLGQRLDNLKVRQSAVGNEIKRTANNAQDFADKAGLALRRFTAFTIATGGVFGAIRGISSAISEAISFEREMLRVTQVTKALPTQIEGLRKTIRGLSSEFGTESKALVESAKVLSQAEFSLADTQVALRAVAQSSLAPTFSDTKETTEALVAVYKQFNIEAKDLGKTLSIIDTVSAKFAVEADDIVKAVQRAGGVFAASSQGIVSGNEALAQFAALITSVRATTRESAETIATGLRTIIARLQRPVTVQFLEDLGIQLRDANGQFVGTFEAIQRIGRALKTLPGTDTKFSQIVEQIGGFRQVSKVIPLIQQTDLQVRALNEALAGQDSISQSAAEAQGNLAVELSKTREEFEALIRDVVDSDAFQVMALGANSLARALIAVTDALSDVLPLMAAIAGLKFASTFAKSGGIRTFAQRVFTNNKEDGLKFNTGGDVPGVGSSDTVPAMLTPGEYVIKKSTASRLGKGFLDRLNKAGDIRGYAKGGLVGYADGGEVLAGNSDFRNYAEGFSKAAQKLGATTAEVEKIVNSLAKTTIHLDDAMDHMADSLVKLSNKVEQQRKAAIPGGGTSSGSLNIPRSEITKANSRAAEKASQKALEAMELKQRTSQTKERLKRSKASRELNILGAPKDAFTADLVATRMKTRAENRASVGGSAKKIAISNKRDDGTNAISAGKTLISGKELSLGNIKSRKKYKYGQVTSETLGLGSAGLPLTQAQINRIDAEKRYADSVFNSSAGSVSKPNTDMSIGVAERKIAARKMTKAEYKTYSSQQRAIASGNIDAIAPGFNNVDAVPLASNLDNKYSQQRSSALTSRQARVAYVASAKQRSLPFRDLRRSVRRTGLGLNLKSANIGLGLAAAAASQSEDPHVRNVGGSALGAGSLAALAGAGPVGTLAAGAVGATYGLAKGSIESKQLEAQNRLDDSTKNLAEAFGKLSENAQKAGRILAEDIANVVQKNIGRDQNLQNKLVEDQTTVGNSIAGLFIGKEAQDSMRYRAAAGETLATTIAENFSGAVGGSGLKNQALREDRGRNLIIQQRAEGNKEAAQTARDFITQEIRSGRGMKNITRDILNTSVSDNVDAIRSGSQSIQTFEANKQFAEIEKTVQAQQKLELTYRKADITLSAMNESAARAVDIIGIFGQELQANNNILGGIAGRALGPAGETGGTRINPFENIKALSGGDLNAAITSLENSLGGRFGGDTKSLVQANSVLQQLGPEIRKGLVETGELKGGSGVALQEALANELRGDPRLGNAGKLAGLPDNIKNQLRAGIDNLTPEDAARFADTGDISQVLGKLSPTVENVTAAMAKLQEASNQLQDSLLAGANQRTAIFDRGNALFGNLKQVESDNRQRREELLGYGTTSKNAIIDGRIAVGSLTGGTADPMEILQNIQGLETDRASIMNAGPLNADSAMQVSELNASINSNKEALNKLSGSVIGLAQIQQELARIESRRQGAQDAVIGSVFATPEQMEQNARGALALQKFNETGNFQSLNQLGLSKQDLESGFRNRLNFLQSTGTEEEVDRFKTGFTQQLGGAIKAAGGDPSVLGTLDAKGAFGLKGQGEEAKQQETLLKQEEERQKQAIQAQITLLQNATTEFDAKFQESFAKGLNRLQEAATQLSIPENITMSVQHSDINVNLNGGDFLTSLQPYIQQQATQIVNAEIQKMTGGETSPLKAAYNVAKNMQAARRGTA